jgi:hypothetical protein
MLHLIAERVEFGSLDTEPDSELGMQLALMAVGGEDLWPKPVNLPAWKSVAIDMSHIEENHIQGGSGVSASKTIFPSYMSSSAVETSVRTAYRYGARVRTQGDRVLVVGPSDGGYTIAMWVNTKTHTIETAYPVF